MDLIWEYKKKKLKQNIIIKFERKNMIIGFRIMIIISFKVKNIIISFDVEEVTTTLKKERDRQFLNQN